MRRPRPAPLAMMAVVLTLGTASACLNDRDTSAEAVERLPAVVDVITGRFARNPPLYYEMRIERSAVAIATNPDDLAAYDDAAVACDRLGRFEEAIDWMARKLNRMGATSKDTPELREHRYRYHANLGTHLVHRWIKAGADRTDMDDARAARDHIALAVEINPDAHFGRERFQLAAIEWIIDGPAPVTVQGRPRLSVYVDETWQEAPPTQAIEGLCGLIVLGNAWESVDTFLTLSLALDALNEPALAYMARLRCEELIDDGRGSLAPGTPKGDDLKRWLGPTRFYEAHNTFEGIQREFRERRAEAGRLADERTAYLEARLAAGDHPDTNPDFWAEAPSGIRTLAPDPNKAGRRIPGGYIAPREGRAFEYEPFIRLTETTSIVAVLVLLLLFVGIPTGIMLLIGYLFRRWRRRARRPVQQDPEPEHQPEPETELVA